MFTFWEPLSFVTYISSFWFLVVFIYLLFFVSRLCVLSSASPFDVCFVLFFLHLSCLHVWLFPSPSVSLTWVSMRCCLLYFVSPLSCLRMFTFASHVSLVRFSSPLFTCVFHLLISLCVHLSSKFSSVCCGDLLLYCVYSCLWVCQD